MSIYIKKKLIIFLKIILTFMLKFETSSKILTLINSYDKFEKKKIFEKEIYLVKKNYVTRYRNDTILTKEPETIKWIQEMDKNSIFYDVGANIGLYSIISGMLNSKKVVAFEPSFFNLQILSKNIFKNKLAEKILIVPISLDSNISQGFFNLSTIEQGGANSSFENEQTILNKNNVLKYNTISLTLDEFLKNFNKLKPDYLKIDVDGIESQILKGGSKVLENVKSVLIESNSTDDEREIIKLMDFFKLKPIEKKKDSYNLIFNKV